MLKKYYPAFLKKIKKFLNIQKDGVYIDCTFGSGKHSLEILKNLCMSGKLFSFDIDNESLLINSKKIQDSRLNIINSNFCYMEYYIKRLGLEKKINGIIFDLGLSTWQLDKSNRGFSFLRNDFLDMRMNKNIGVSAMYWLNHANEKDIFNVIKNYGEDFNAKNIAKKIVFFRKKKTLEYTQDLVKIIKYVVGSKKYIKSLARVFQSIRIYINNELNSLINGLKAAYNILSSKGRLVVISFHSLEDKIVKKFIYNKTNINIIPDIPLTDKQINKFYSTKMINLGKYKPSAKEIINNNRIRSAILRVAEKK